MRQRGVRATRQGASLLARLLFHFPSPDASFSSLQNTSGRLFRDSQLTYSDFMEQEAIPDSPDLVIKYAGRYLTWDNASPVLASLAVYRKSLVEHPELHRSVDESTPPTKSTGRRGWGLWWGRGRGGTAPPEDTQTVSSLPATAQASPPTSPPDSPRSEPALEAPAAQQQLGDEHDGDEFPPEDHTKHYAKTLRLTSDQLVRPLPSLAVPPPLTRARSGRRLTLSPFLLPAARAQAQEGHEPDLVHGALVVLGLRDLHVAHLPLGLGLPGRHFRHRRHDHQVRPLFPSRAQARREDSLTLSPTHAGRTRSATSLP